MALFVITLMMWFAPKIATVLDVLSRPKLRRAFGGAGRFVLSTVTETIFFLMLSPIMWFGHTMFLAGLLLGRTLGWGGQARDDHAVPWSDAARQLWPHTLLGWFCILVLAFTVPAAIPYALFIAGGPALSIPLAVVTASPGFGRLLMRAGIGRLPEENAPPECAARAGAAGDRCRGASGGHDRRAPQPRAASSARCASITATRPRAAMDRLYAGFVQPGDLVFDVGAHVGDRVAAFRRLGARVVAVEPQPALVTTLRLLYGRDRAVAIEPVAVGRAAGTIELKLNVDNPTVSTASDDFIQAADGAPGWEGQAWAKTITVPVTTLDALIARHGMPAFIKIDVEGFEAEALAGLTQPGAGAVVRVHHHPARRGGGPASSAAWRSAMRASMPRSARARSWFMDWQGRRRHRALARGPAGCGQFRRYLRVALRGSMPACHATGKLTKSVHARDRTAMFAAIATLKAYPKPIFNDFRSGIWRI